MGCRQLRSEVKQPRRRDGILTSIIGLRKTDGGTDRRTRSLDSSRQVDGNRSLATPKRDQDSDGQKI